jgi:GTPase SAR1 family protein
MDPRKNRQKKRNSSALYLKIIVLGDAGIGKTCLINRYIGGCYKDTFSSTLGVDFKVKDLECS